jgi:hypothetical protein
LKRCAMLIRGVPSGMFARDWIGAWYRFLTLQW